MVNLCRSHSTFNFHYLITATRKLFWDTLSDPNHSNHFPRPIHARLEPNQRNFFSKHSATPPDAIFYTYDATYGWFAVIVF